MPISFACQHCQKTYNVADNLAGKKVKCKACGQAMDVPAQQAISAQAKPASRAGGAPAAQSRSRSAAAPTQTRQQPTSRSTRPANAAQTFGLGALDENDLFAGAAPGNHQQNPLANHIVGDPGFAPITPEEVAYRRQMEFDQLRNTRPKLEDYLQDEDVPIRPSGTGGSGSAAYVDEHAPTGFKPFIPALVSVGAFFLIALMTVIGSIFSPLIALFGLIGLIVALGVVSIGGQIWGMTICYRYHHDKFIWYFLFPIYRIGYIFQNFNIMKGPFGLIIATFVGAILLGGTFAITAAITGGIVE